MLSFRPPWSGRRAAERAAADNAAPAAAPTGVRGPVRAALRLMAVEPRMLFDGAAVVTADAVIAIDKTAPVIGKTLPGFVNHLPEANPDVRVVDEGQSICDGQVIHGNAKGDVADVDADGDGLTVIGVAVGPSDKPVSGAVGTTLTGTFGRLELQANGEYCYTATADLKPGQAGQDIFTYTVVDSHGGVATTTLTVIVCGLGEGGGRAPTPQADCRDVSACDVISDGQAVAGNALGDAPDSDPDGDKLAVTGVVAGEPGGTPAGGVGTGIAGCYGTLTLQADGSYTYVPFTDLQVPAGGALIDVFTYTVTDPSGLSASTTLTIAVEPCCDDGGNLPPVAVDDARTIFEGQRIDDGHLIAGNAFGDRADSDPEGGKLMATGVAAGRTSATLSTGIDLPIAGLWGTLTLCDDGTYVYVPNEAAQSLRAGQTVTDVFSYSIVDPACATANATLTITIIGLNDAPTANDDGRCIDVRGTVADGDAIRGNMLGDVADFDADAGDVLSVVGARAGTPGGPVSGGVATGLVGAWGTLTIAADGRYTYVPDARALTVGAGQEVMDVFTYTIRDPEGALATATITICMEGVQGGGGGGGGSLLANADQRTTDERTAIAGNVVTGGQPGERPDLDSEGRPITVQGLTAGVTDAAQSGRVGQGVAGSWGTLTLQADGSYTYVPSALARGLGQGDVVEDVFTYTVRDDAGRVSTTTLTIRVVGLNDAPKANPDLRTIDERGTITNGDAVRGNALGDTADTDGDATDTLTVIGAAPGTGGGPVNGGVGTPLTGSFGTLTIDAQGRYTYVPDPLVLNLRAGEQATDTFTYTIRDSAGVTSTATITIRITGVDAALQANADQRTTDERSAVTGNAVTAGQPGERADVDSEGRPIVVQGVTAGATGATLTAGVGAPIAGTWGTLVLAADGTYTWTPNAAARGLTQGQLVEDVFTYTVNDGGGGRVSTTTITIRVNGLNDAPTANPDQRTIDERGTVTNGDAVRGNAFGDSADTDPDGGDPLTVIGAAPGTGGGPASTGVGTPLTGAWGTLTIDAQGRYTYVPGPQVLDLAAGQVVTDTFTYTIRDGAGVTSTSTITIRITGVDGVLEANADQRTTDERTSVTGNAVTAGQPGERADVDSEGRPIVVQGVAAGATGATLTTGVGAPVTGTWGTLVLTADGGYAWTPNAAARGLAQGQLVEDVYTYTVNDGAGRVSTTTITIRVTGLNDAPVAAPDARTVTVGDRIGDGQAVVGNAAGDQRDSDPDGGDTIRVIGAAPGTATGPLAGGVGTPLTGTYGTLTINPDGSYVYVPGGPAALALAPGQSVRDTFTYTIDDGNGGRSSTTIAFNVIGANHPPTANPDGKVITAGATDPVTGNAVANGTTGDRADTDPDQGDALTVTAVRAGTDGTAAPVRPGDPVRGAYGTLVLNQDGSYSYRLDNTNPDVAGLPVGGRLFDTFTYTVRDGSGATSSTTITVEVVRPADGAGAPPVSPVPTPLNPGTTPSAGGSYAALTPVYSEVTSKPPAETAPPISPDPFNPFGVERVKGAVEEKEGSSMTEEAPEVVSAKKPVNPGDDCIPEDKLKAQRKAVVAKDAPKPKARPSVFAKDHGAPAKSFSEQVTAAKKRFKPPVKVQPPAPTQRIC